jgi:hypothetical protein
MVLRLEQVILGIMAELSSLLWVNYYDKLKSWQNCKPSRLLDRYWRELPFDFFGASL